MANGNTMDQSRELQQNLLDNALDFLLSAAEAVRRDEGHRTLKDAVLHLGNGIELLLKARLAREHWSLIFSDINKASYDELAKAEFASVDYPTALKRLEQIVGVSIDESIGSHIVNLRKLRNRLTHFTATLDPAQAKSLVAKSMNFCVEFCEQEDMVTGDAEGKIREIHMNLTDLQEFVDDRMANILEGWEDALIWECPECWQEALVIDGGQVDCKFCLRKADPKELADDNSDSNVVEDCPECGEEASFALVLFNNEEGRWICFSCGQSGEEYEHCMRCNRMASFPDRDDVKICNSCWTDMARSK